jgi:hypothetical protein
VPSHSATPALSITLPVRVAPGQAFTLRDRYCRGAPAATCGHHCGESSELSCLPYGVRSRNGYPTAEWSSPREYAEWVRIAESNYEVVVLVDRVVMALCALTCKCVAHTMNRSWPVYKAATMFWTACCARLVVRRYRSPTRGTPTNAKANAVADTSSFA